MEGEAAFGGDEKRHRSDQFHTLVLSNDGSGLEVNAPEGEEEKPCSFVLFAAEPIKEEVVQTGPFVLSSNKQIQQSVLDLQMSRNGFEGAKNWHSEIGFVTTQREHWPGIK